jgi:serine O-acetyltransferase
MFKTIREDIENILRKDPAARSVVAVLFFYPGLHAVWMHRLANMLWRRRLYFLGRFISHFSRFMTGIEIHPGAKIGRRFFIDHGSGVVIGETAEIADDVHIYQGVVLGGVSLQKGKRHPTLRNGVMVGAGAIVLGPITLGEGARVGAASLVVNNVPPKAVAVGVPARVGMGFSEKELQELADNNLPDPIAEAIRFLGGQIELLEKRIGNLEEGHGGDMEMDILSDEKKKILRIFAPTDEGFITGAGI